MHLARFPYKLLADLPTPLERLDRLSGSPGADMVITQGATGLIGLVRKGYFKAGERVMFLHTGGAAGLFGDTSAFGG